MSNLGTGGATRIGTGQSIIAGLYLALGTGQGSGALLGEPSGGGYARQAVTLTPSGSVLNISSATFGTFTQGHGTMTHAGLFDAASGGNCIWVGALDAAVNIVADTTVTQNNAASKITLELAA